MKPLLISSIKDHPTDLGYLDRAKGDFEHINVQDWKPTDHQVIFFRCAYETELKSALLPKIMEIASYYRNKGCKLVNDPIKTIVAHRKDIWYSKISAAPRFISNPTYYEILAHIKSNLVSYPFIYRLADAAAGAGVFLITKPEELLQAFKQITKYPRFSRTMVVDFLEERIGKFYGGLRIRVINSKIEDNGIGRTVLKGWKWERSNDPELEEAKKKERDSFVLPDSVKEIIQEISNTLMIDIYSLEFILTKDGPKVIDINPCTWYARDTNNGHFENAIAYIKSL